MASDDHSRQSPALLSPADPPPVSIVNPDGASPFLFIGDHAGNVIPKSLDRLGLAPADRARHIAIDIGVAELGAMLADALDAVFIRQTYSRLVIDCNRRPDAADAMPAVSDGTPIPGNAALTDPCRRARVAAIHEPYHQAIDDEIARRRSIALPTILIALHSFTPALQGRPRRPWQIGVLHDGGDPSFATGLLRWLARDRDLIVGDNQPYRMDAIDYTVPRHAYPASLPYAELEIRQDLLADRDGCARWAALVGEALAAGGSGRYPL